MTTTETAATPTDSYPAAYVPDLMTQWAAARELHARTERWFTEEAPEGSWATKADALAGLADESDLFTFSICIECGRIEEQAHSIDDEWQYLDAIWPCATAKALGAATS